MAGDDPEAKATVSDLLRSFGWQSILDLGGVVAARGMEQYRLLWNALASAQGTEAFNLSGLCGPDAAVRRDRGRWWPQWTDRGRLPGPGRPAGAGAGAPRRASAGRRSPSTRSARTTRSPHCPMWSVCCRPSCVRDLDLAEHGLHVYPQGPYFAPRRDGRYLQLPDDPARRAAAIGQFSTDRRRRVRAVGGLAGQAGPAGRPAAARDPADARLAPPADLVDQAGLLARLRGVDVRAAVDLTRLFSASVADLVEDRFSSDAMRGLLSVSGVIGMWAGPRSAGTGVRHAAPPPRPDRRAGGRVGLPARRHGRGDPGPGRRRPVVRGGDPHRHRGGPHRRARRRGLRRDPADGTEP